MTKSPSISLCMIARDEELWLEQALKSVQPLIDEFILVDTGSVDRTKEIATEYGAQIIDEPWEDNFSKHRSTSMKFASCDWILVLDADEVIDESQHEMVRKLTTKDDHCYLMVQRHYTDDHRLSGFTPCVGELPEWEREHIGYFESSLCRLFPNDPRIEYRGQVHELVEHSIGEHADLILAQSPIRLHHYGNTQEAKQRKKKSKLYTPLGQQKVNEQPGTWKAYYELGVEHNCNGRQAESAEALKKAAELKPDYTPTWINYGYVLMELERYKDSFYALSKALELEPKNPEAHCNIGVLYMRQKNYHLAVGHLRRSIELKPDYLNAYSNLGLSLMNLGDVAEATKVFQAGYELSPRNGQLLLQFGYSLLELGVLEEARVVLLEAVNLTPNDAAAWHTLGRTFEGLEMGDEAKEAFQKFQELSTQ